MSKRINYLFRNLKIIGSGWGCILPESYDLVNYLFERYRKNNDQFVITIDLYDWLLTYFPKEAKKRGAASMAILIIKNIEDNNWLEIPEIERDGRHAVFDHHVIFDRISGDITAVSFSFNKKMISVLQNDFYYVQQNFQELIVKRVIAVKQLYGLLQKYAKFEVSRGRSLTCNKYKKDLLVILGISNSKNLETKIFNQTLKRYIGKLNKESDISIELKILNARNKFLDTEYIFHVIGKKSFKKEFDPDKKNASKNKRTVIMTKEKTLRQRLLDVNCKPYFINKLLDQNSTEDIIKALDKVEPAIDKAKDSPLPIENPQAYFIAVLNTVKKYY